MTISSHTTKETQYISFVLPVFNEENNLQLLFEQISSVMKSLPYKWELIFIDDGSTDNSLECIKKLSTNNSEIQFISFLKNCGQSAAFTAGFEYASGELIITMDSDLQNDPNDIPNMLEEYFKGYDMVIGWRAKRQDTFAKRLASRLANKIRNAISQETVQDTGCSLKLMRTSMAKKLPMFTGMHRFLPTLMKMQGAKVAEVKVHHRQRYSGTSKYSTWGRAKTAFFDLLAVRWMKKRHFNYEIKESNIYNNSNSK